MMRKVKIDKVKGILMTAWLVGSAISAVIIFMQIGTGKKICPIAITAHRGDSGHAPENTLEAIELAIQKGADYAEIDVRQTKDGVLVLMHDSSLARTAGVDKTVENSSYQELQQLDVGSWYNPEYQGAAIPTLAEALELSKGRIRLNIELKGAEENKEISLKAVKLLQSREMVSDCTITSTNYNYLKSAEAEDNNIRTGIILSSIDDFESYNQVDFYSVSLSALDNEGAQRLEQTGRELHVWTINQNEDIERAVQLKADNIITDVPEETRMFLSGR